MRTFAGLLQASSPAAFGLQIAVPQRVARRARAWVRSLPVQCLVVRTACLRGRQRVREAGPAASQSWDAALTGVCKIGCQVVWRLHIVIELLSKHTNISC